jgi:uncharacterized protein (DUF2126 family)
LDPALHAEAAAHDAAVARCGVDLWIGAEPTFTDRRSQEPWWLWTAEGGDKEERARALLLALAPRLPGPVRLLRARGRQYPGEAAPRFCLGALHARQRVPRPDTAREEARAADLSGAVAADGALTAAIVPPPSPGGDEAWLTVTPDPAVIEVNLAPAHDLATFAGWCEALYGAAGEVGLAPLRYRYNGDVTDSGGGGQLTLGGPTAEDSPFFRRPQLLPRLVRYLNRHPSLSYAFAPDCTGSAGQGPRADEGVRERFEELPVALELLSARGDRATPDELWSALAPLLVDSAGNSHRAELNVEKLWNPWHEERGRLGLVELRALRMPATPERLVAIAALFRAVAARLAVSRYEEPLVDWGAQLHERFGLPWFQRRDLEWVLDDLDAHGLGPGPTLRAELLRAPEPIATVELDGARLEIAPALAFWPLFGDVASQERSGARLVDASSARVQLSVRSPAGELPGHVSAAGWRVPLQAAGGDEGVRIGSVLYRTFAPRPGLHPALGPEDPLVVAWERNDRRVRVELHAWIPAGGAYDGLPADDAEARRRRRERVVVSTPVTAVDVRASGATGFFLDVRRAGAPGLQPPAAPHEEVHP